MTYFATALAVFLLCAWVIALLICPRTVWVDEWHSNASNSPLKITMRRGLQYPAAVWAQEYYESRYNLTRPWMAWLLAIGNRVGWRWPQRRLELMGHAVELAAIRAVYGIEGAAYQAYLTREVASMRHGYAAFRDMTEGQIAAALFERASAAATFVRRHRKKIKKIKSHKG